MYNKFRWLWKSINTEIRGYRMYLYIFYQYGDQMSPYVFSQRTGSHLICLSIRKPDVIYFLYSINSGTRVNLTCSFNIGTGCHLYLSYSINARTGIHLTFLGCRLTCTCTCTTCTFLRGPETTFKCPFMSINTGSVVICMLYQYENRR